MSKIFTSTSIAGRIWLLTSVILGSGWLIGCLVQNEAHLFFTCFPVTIVAMVASLPALIVLLFAVPHIERRNSAKKLKIFKLAVVCFACTLIYGTIGGLITASFENSENWWTSLLIYGAGITAVLFICSLLALFFSRKALLQFFTSSQPNLLINQFTTMETTQHSDNPWENTRQGSTSNKILLKGVITGALILVLMIPTVFIMNLIGEREARQKEVAAEVSSKWSAAQTLTGPYIYLPYTTYYKDRDGKVREGREYLWILPDNLTVTGRIEHEIRPRSIYKVLLYRTELHDTGQFVLQIPKDIDPDAIQWSGAKICYGLSDFKGIEERLAISLNGTEYELSPGLPATSLNDKGLSASIHLAATDSGKSIPFNIKLKLKGSGHLHFIPLGGNSSFELKSGWGNPSFDGNNLPTERKVTDSGFSAKWVFNKANLPFGTVLKDFKFDQNSFAFGVTMLQPADQYAKTSRCVKYAILFIGLTFALFFIVELMQKKPVHPVQYVLIGLALVIFYTLLLSISEFILFDQAYLIAALATIFLISLYARGHFQSWKSAGLFGGILTILYGFIFILIRLEDTALLVGSIGLFMVLALVMYASRKINWYGTAESTQQ